MITRSHCRCRFLLRILFVLCFRPRDFTFISLLCALLTVPLPTYLNYLTATRQRVVARPRTRRTPHQTGNCAAYTLRTATLLPPCRSHPTRPGPPSPVTQRLFHGPRGARLTTVGGGTATTACASRTAAAGTAAGARGGAKTGDAADSTTIGCAAPSRQLSTLSAVPAAPRQRLSCPRVTITARADVPPLRRDCIGAAAGAFATLLHETGTRGPAMTPRLILPEADVWLDVPALAALLRAPESASFAPTPHHRV